MIVNGKNAGYALRDEIFKWQDKLDDMEYSEDGMMQLYLLTEDILDTLESRLDLSDEFIAEMKAIDHEIESGDMSDFIEVELPKRSFFDYVNDYADATKIGDVVQASSLLLHYVNDHICDVDTYISHNRLYIKQKDNTSLSTSIIADLLGIKAKDIDDRNSFELEWSILLNRR